MGKEVSVTTMQASMVIIWDGTNEPRLEGAFHLFSVQLKRLRNETTKRLRKCFDFLTFTCAR
jgi:hypothetical protein